MISNKLLIAICGAAFFWILALHVGTGFLNFMVDDGVGSRAGMVALIDGFIDSALVEPLGKSLATISLAVLGALNGLLIYRGGNPDDDR